MRSRQTCPDRPFPVPGYDRTDHASFADCRRAILTCADPHCRAFYTWALEGGGHRISRLAWSVGASAGRSHWDSDRTTFNSGTSPRSFTTGGISTEFDRRIANMLENEKFILLTSSVTVVAKDQYMCCWRRWAQFSACSGLSPWIQDTRRGRDNTLIEFLIWEHKLLGLQHSALTRRFYAVRYIHIADGYDDFSLRAHRIRGILKAIKLRGETCKEIPFNTDLSRWQKRNIPVELSPADTYRVSQLWTGLLMGFSFVSGFRKYWPSPTMISKSFKNRKE